MLNKIKPEDICGWQSKDDSYYSENPIDKIKKEAHEKNRRREEAQAKMDQGIGIDPAEYFELFGPTEWPEGTC